MSDGCDHDHEDPKDPLFTVSASLGETPDGQPMLHVALVHCPHLGDGEMLAVCSALSRALAELADGARAAIARSN